MLRRFTLLCALCAPLAFAASARAATIWTPINSGTTGTISAIDYQSATRFWYATTGGQVASFNGSSFVHGTGITPGDNITGLAFQPGGAVGFAVASNGDVFHSLNSGATWTAVAHPTTRTSCAPSSTPVAETELNSVVWSSSTTVFLLGDNSTVLRSTAATGNTPVFTEINKNAATCAMQTESSSQDFTGATFLPGNPDNALFVTRDFGRIYQSSNASTAGSPSGTLLNDDTTNSFEGDPKIARDPSDPSRVFVVDHDAGGAGCGTLCLEVSSNGGAQIGTAKFLNDTHPVGALFGITSVGGVEVAAGGGGEILTSDDGTNFYNQLAGGVLATENWRAVGAYDAAHAAVGGDNGALAVTTAANTIPDIIAPTGTISGPTSVTSGQATTSS